MNPPPTVPPAGWPRSRFWGIVGIIFVLQTGMLLLFGEHDHKARPAKQSGAGFHLLSAPLTADQLSKIFFALDPTVFPLPGAHGFSERAWLNAPAPVFEMPSQTEGPAWLAIKTNQLGAHFAQLPQSKTGVPFGLNVPSSAEMEPWPISLRPEKFRSQSLFELSAGLRERQLNAPSTLPPRANLLLLSNSVVQIAVDSAGQVIAARLIGRSGSVEADNSAVEEAQNLRFRPAPASAPVWGDAIFEWQTLAPSNGAPAPLH